MNISPERKRFLQIERENLIADIKKKAAISRRFINDKRHADYKAFLEFAIQAKQSELETLGDSVSSTDEFVKKGLVLTTEIKTIRWILSRPEKMIEFESKITEVKEK
jgi:hypothetical protein